MKNKMFCLICLFGFIPFVAPVVANQIQTEVSYVSVENEAQAAFQYLYNEVEQDDFLTKEEQHQKLQEFQHFADQLTPEVAARLTSLLLQETRLRILDILQNAGLDSLEIDAHLADNEQAISNVQNMTVEIARQMLFFVAELKIHRQYVYDFGIALGCPAKQLLLHDLCKLHTGQFEGYARYFRGGKRDEDKAAYLAAWGLHQHAEHHLESYSKKGFDFESFSEERLRNNMHESVSDWLASTKQRGGGTLIHYLVNIFPKKNLDPRLLPYVEEALKKAHALYLISEENPTSDSLFKGLPCWNSDVEKVFRRINP